MKRSDLVFQYPDSLIALEPSRPTRVMWVDQTCTPKELTIAELIEKIPAGDVFVINNTKVLKRRVFAKDQLQNDIQNDIEVLFLDQLHSNSSSNESSNEWSVLFPSKKFKIGEELILPNGFKMQLLEKGRPQKVKVVPAIAQKDFDQMAELPLPPYIQRARQDRHNHINDESWYQTAWAEKAGSFAAPTASLHFTAQDIQKLKNQGVQVVELTLHVGLGTFLPVLTEDLNDHKMHEEIYQISPQSWQIVQQAQQKGRGIWSLGTTSTRVLESVARTGILSGSTDILLQEGCEFKIVNRLLTNFHQPESTLLALVAGYMGLQVVLDCYDWAVAKKFKLFSYGDLSVWVK